MTRKPLLIEIGHEELPARFVNFSGQRLLEALRRLFQEVQLEHGPARWLATPRRTAVLFQEVAPATPEQVEEVQGPPRKVAYDEEGRPTRALQGFLKKLGITENEVKIRKVGQREYVVGMVRKPSVPLAEILQRHLEQILQSIPFAKTMRWGPPLRFPRPIRWIAALYGSEVLPLQAAGLKAHRKTYGNRLAAPGPFELPSAEAYEATLKQAFVIPDFQERRQAVLQALQEAAREVNGVPVDDPDLLDEVTNLVEYPTAILGRYDEAFLSLPAPIVITAMKQHQRYFAVLHPDDPERLLPYFVAVINNPKADPDLVRRGLEEVLVARLEDARFYFETDTRRRLEDRVEDLKSIVWFKGLGSVYDKVQRVRNLVDHLIQLLEGQVSLDVGALRRAALLYKTDITTEMIRDGKEFTKLEGTIGRYYALKDGEPESVAHIIEECHRPRFAGDRLPERLEAALLGIADRVDTLVALLSTGYEPTGAQDPMGLRRLAYGLIDLILAFQLPLDLEQVFGAADFSEEARQKAVDFVLRRFEHYLEEREGIRYDIVDAVIGSGLRNLLVLAERARALHRMMQEKPEDFEKLVIGQKRLANILKSAPAPPGEPEPDLFEKPEEEALYRRVQEIEAPFHTFLAQGAYDRALQLLLDTRPYIDAFFDHVFVMVEDPRVRENRLRLLEKTRSLFARFADFSRIVVAGE